MHRFVPICGVPDVHPSTEFAPSNYKIKYILVKLMFTEVHNIQS